MPTASTPTRPLLDHLILLASSLPLATAHFSGLGFAVHPGGTHADGLTENALVSLPDGVYLELIAFLPGAARSAHWWGAKTPNGWADWALTPPAGMSAADVLAAMHSSASARGGREQWNAPRAGGRRTPEGRQLEWEVAFPNSEICGMRGRLPFICADKTPREWRVPSSPPGARTNSAEGFAKLVLLARPGGLAAYAEGLTAMLDAISPNGPDDPSRRLFRVATPSGGAVEVEVKEPECAEEEVFVTERGEGLYKVSVRRSLEGNRMDTLPADSTMGRITFV